MTPRRTVPTTLSPAMAARYGEDRSRHGTWVLIVTVVAVFLAIIGLVTYWITVREVHSQLIKFVVVSDQRVDVTFEVQRDGAKTTTCVLRAQNVHHADVGYATVTITPGRDYVQPTYALATSGRADTAEVLGCSENGPPHVDPPQFAPGTVNPPQQPTISGT